MLIDAMFDGGNIEVVSIDKAEDIQLKIRCDRHADYRQWFYFRLTAAANIYCQFNLINAAEVTWPEFWTECRIVASYDRQTWFRLETRFDQSSLYFELTPKKNIVYFASFAPYSYERHQDLISKSLQHPLCFLHKAVPTVEGRQIEMLRVGEIDAKKKGIWITARQHPAETMAEWFMEGLLDRLLDNDDACSRSLLESATLFLIPNMNPDGCIAGNLRTNGAGIDLNRAWSKPSVKNSPEVYFVLSEMEKHGVDLYLDIHGDEEIPFVFAAGSEGIPNYSERLATLDNEFRHVFHNVNPDFCCDNGYPPDPPGEGNLSIAANQVALRFDCLSLTIEMPFKDNKYLPNVEQGWSPTRSSMLGASVIPAIHRMLSKL